MLVRTMSALQFLLPDILDALLDGVLRSDVQLILLRALDCCCSGIRISVLSGVLSCAGQYERGTQHRCMNIRWMMVASSAGIQLSSCGCKILRLRWQVMHS